MTNAELPGALAMLTAMLADSIVPIAWFGMRSGKSPARAAALAGRQGLRLHPHSTAGWHSTPARSMVFAWRR